MYTFSNFIAIILGGFPVLIVLISVIFWGLYEITLKHLK